MKITKIEPLLCDSAWGVWVFIKVQTDEGITGWGECSDHRGCTYGMLGCVKDLEMALIGKIPARGNYTRICTAWRGRLLAVWR